MSIPKNQPSFITSCEGMEITWHWHYDQSFPHLSGWKATCRGLALQFRELYGCDFNRTHEAQGLPARQYEGYVTFDADETLTATEGVVNGRGGFWVELYRDRPFDVANHMTVQIAYFILATGGSL